MLSDMEYDAVKKLEAISLRADWALNCLAYLGEYHLEGWALKDLPEYGEAVKNVERIKELAEKWRASHSHRDFPVR